VSDFSILGGGSSVKTYGFTSSTNTGVSVTASSTVNTKGSYVELVSAANNTTPINNMFSIGFDLVTGTQADFLVDIAIGGAGSEVVIIDNIWVKTNTIEATSGIFEALNEVPAGVRISARCQSNISSGVIPVYLMVSSRSLAQSSRPQRVTTYGANASTTDGVVVARAAVGVFGSWVEITASTTNRIKGFIVASHRKGLSWSNGKITYEVGVGSAGNEEIIYAGHNISVNSSEMASDFFSPAILVAVAKGERLAIRALADVANVDFDASYTITGFD
jgi:hypothetical protein